MPIDLKCQKCGRELRAPDNLAGQRIRCPRCKGVIPIPALEEANLAPIPSPPPEPMFDPEPEPAPRPQPKKAAKASKSPPTPPKPAADASGWYLRTEDGQEYGPAGKAELDSWLKEGRIDASCQLLREGWEQWKWAEDVYPSLAQPVPEPPAAPVPPEPAVEEDIFAAIATDADAAPAVAVAEVEANPYVSPRETPKHAARDSSAPSGGVVVTPEATRALAETKPWVTFLAILGFIAGGFGVLAALGYTVLSVAVMGPLGVIVVLGAIGPALYLLAAYFLFTYGQKIGLFLRKKSSHELEAALVAQKSFWKLTGIVTAVALGLYLVMIVLMIVVMGVGAVAMQKQLDQSPTATKIDKRIDHKRH